MRPGSSAALAFAWVLATPVAAQEIPPDALHCALRAPPDAAAKGVRPPRSLPARMYPVNPGDHYTGCQWIWIAMARPDVWDYSSVTFYENGTPRIQRITYPPLPAQITIQKCAFGADGKPRKSIEGGNDWQLDCHSERQLKELLRVTPKEDGAWEFF
jgi:hypothetical protein